jgi:hypothetical protein
LYAPVAKLSALPLLVVLPFIFYCLPANRKKLITAMTLAGVLLYLPWLGRNYILSGYLVYPLSVTGILNPDWKVPKDLVLLDYTFIKYGPRIALNDPAKLQAYKAMSVAHSFTSVIATQFREKIYAELFMLFAGLASPLLWIKLYARKEKPAPVLFGYWLCVFAGVLSWLIFSGDYRFGFVFLAMGIVIPLLLLLQTAGAGLQKLAGLLLPVLLIAGTAYYLSGALQLYRKYNKKTGRSYTLQQPWILPFRHASYDVYKKEGFPFKMLQNGVRLYLQDSVHSCITTGCLPCMQQLYGEIEMRGQRIEEGFRNTRDDVRKNFPIIQ